MEASDFPNGITDSEINQYLSQSEVQFDQSEWRQKIGLQKWIALFGQGVQNWISTRRIGYPALEMPEITTYDTFPTRLPYPRKEQSLNETNYNEAVSRQGPDDIVTNVWWDVDF